MRFKRIIAALLLIITAVSTLSSCEKDREYDEAVVKREAEQLIKKSIPLNEIYYGKGFLYTDEGEGNYKKIAEGEAERYGIESIDVLKEKTLQVFSKSWSETIFTTLLSGQNDGEHRTYARYLQYSKGEESYIVVNIAHEYQMTNTIEYDFSGINVIGAKGEKVTISVPVTLTRTDGGVKSDEIRISMIEEENGWRLSGSSHAVYNEYSDGIKVK